jgi:hypothetical protein
VRSLQSNPNSTVHQILTSSSHLQVFFIITMDPIIFSITEQDPLPSEEALIDRDYDVFDTKITVSFVSVSRANLSDHVGRQLPFLEVIQASIVPYIIEVSFPFPEFVGWCAEQYSQEDKVILSRLGSEVLCRID